MPELTSQDRESYKKLRDAAIKLSSKDKTIPAAIPAANGPKIGESFFLKELTDEFVTKLPQEITSFDELQAQVELTGGYLTMYQLFANAINNSVAKDSINQASQELRIQYNQLKVSLAAIDDDFLDDLIPPCSDPLFLGLLTDPEVKKWTNQILSDQAPELSDIQLQKLINAWGTAVTTFVEDARKLGGVKPTEPKTIAQFFCIHDQLEGLYSELSTSVALNN